MNRWISRAVLLGTIAAVAAAALPARADEEPREPTPPKKKGEVRAERSGGLAGLVLGEDRSRFYPFVTQVAPESPAFYAGIRPGDELIRVQEQPVRDLRDAERLARNVRPGDKIKLFMRRAGLNVMAEFTNPRPQDLSRPRTLNDPNEDPKNAKDPEQKPKKKKRRSVIIKPLPPTQ